MSRVVEFAYRQRKFEIHLTEDGAIELYLDQCLRKRRDASTKQPQYVWTNVELEWEEHHYVEARFWSTNGVLKVTVNGELLMEQQLSLAK